MRIRLSDIGPAGLVIKDILPLAPLNARMTEGNTAEYRRADIRFTEPPVVDLTVKTTVTGVEVRGVIRAKYTQDCGLCLNLKPREVEAPVLLAIQHRSRLSTDPAATEDGVGIMYVDGEHAELEDPLQESLILALSLYWHPPLDQNRKCTLCGQNFSALLGEPPRSEPVQRLGDFLKTARLN